MRQCIGEDAGVVRVVLGQLRHRLGRSLALLLAIAVATTSFTVLTGAAETTRLQVRGRVDESFRSTYDLLVRPALSYTPLEAEQGLVRPNYQAGIFGGITTDQLTAIRTVTGVEVAAPVANLGYVDVAGAVNVPVAPYLNGDAQQLFRIRPTWSMDRGLSRFQGAPKYVYVSRNKTTVVHPTYTRGDPTYNEFPSYAELVPGRRRPVPVCTNYEVDRSAARLDSGRHDTPFGYRDVYAESNELPIICYYTATFPGSSLDAPLGAGDPAALDTFITASIPVLIAAVDPAAETQLSGLDQALVSGRPLTPTDSVTRDSYGNPLIPILAATSTSVDQELTAQVERVQPPPGGALSDVLSGQQGVVAKVDALPGERVGEVPAQAVSDVYTQTLSRITDNGWGAAVGNFWTVGSSAYRQAGPDLLEVRPVTNPESAYASGSFGGGAPVGSDDAAVRAVSGHPLRPNQQDYPGFAVVGQFDPAKVLGDSALSGVTSATYASPLLPGADPASQQLLGGQPLPPSTNIGGYAAQPPTLLTTIAAAGPLLDGTRYQGASADAPISVVRVRVAGVSGTDPVSRERLNQAALAIGQRTGLAVDIVAGASGVPTTVVLPAGDHGRPQLRLLENWARKGVAYTVVDAIDRKSVLLFGLILTVCALLVGNAASAAVRTRRTELGVLSALGWGRGQLFGVVLVELAVVGLAAGVAGAVVAFPVAAALHVSTSLARAAVAVPAAVLLAALAGLVPALQAARTSPINAVQPMVRSPRRARPVRSVAGLAMQSLRRVPGRTLLATASLVIGVAAMTVLLTVQHAFSGLVVGSLLGDAVALQVRPADIAALVVVVILGAAAVSDVLYLSIREQAAELAALQALGWTDRALSRLVLVQGLAFGILGGSVGAALGCTAVISFARTFNAGLILPAVAAAAVGVGVAAAAAIVPAVLIRRLPVAALVAEDA